jgi:putative ABC transport system permease protein
LQDTFVVLQVAVALVLLTGAGLFVESFEHFRRVDPGFRPDGVLTAEIDLPPQRYATLDRQAMFAERVVDQLEAEPGVEAASVSEIVPGFENGFASIGFSIVGDPVLKPGDVAAAYAIAVSPDYFRTMGIRLLRGRVILPSDDRSGPDVAVIDERLAQQIFAGREPIGRQLTWQNLPDTVRIVGVVASVKQRGPKALDPPGMYVPFAQFPAALEFLALRTRGGPAEQSRLLKRVVGQLDPSVPISDVATMDERMASSLGTNRFSAFLATIFAVIALILGMVGIYSVLAYVVNQGHREIAVRIALGARRSDVMSKVLRRALRVTGLGIALGTAGAWALTRALAGLFVGVSPHDPRIFLGAVVAFGAAALVAASVPAFRTTRVNPVAVLNST